MLTAVGLQESEFRVRVQSCGEAAQGFWQFTPSAVRVVLHHLASRTLILPVLEAMGYDEMLTTSYAALRHNDVLACCYARALLWTHVQPLPRPGEHDRAWDYYVELWRPARPARERWSHNYDRAWHIIGDRP